jgi:hypothetical protein
MSVNHRKRYRLLALPLFLLAATATRAEQTARYEVSGPTGAALWGLGSEPGAAVLALAFSRATPIAQERDTAAERDELPPPGPRLVFSVNRWVRLDGEWVRRQWYGDAPLKPEALTTAADLAGGKLDATVTGTLQESWESEVFEHREVTGRLQVQWSAIGGVAQTTLAYAYQTPAHGVLLQTAGPGRAALVRATVTVEGLGPPLEVEGAGSLLEVIEGLLSVTRR